MLLGCSRGQNIQQAEIKRIIAAPDQTGLHAFLVDLTPAAQLGRSQAVFNGSFNLGVLSSAFVFGQVADAVGQRPMFALASLMPLVATAILFACDPALPRGTAKSTVPPALE